MNEAHQTQTETHKIEHYEDEIELIDILKVIWKWKYLILAGTIICGLITAIINLNMANIYSIDMVLRPGILKIGEQGKNVYIDSPQNIKALIESGAYNKINLSKFKDAKLDNIPPKWVFEVKIPPESDTIKVHYETTDSKQGVYILDYLSKLLLKTYGKLVRHFKNEYDEQLSSFKSEIEYKKNVILSKKRNIKNIEKRINELKLEAELIKNNTNNLIVERNRLLSKNPKEKDILSALLYSNTIQQNLQLSNNYQNQINNYKQQKESEFQKVDQSEKEIRNILDGIKNLQFKKDNIQNVQILQPPTATTNPIKPKTKRNVLLALLVGLFLMLFLAFLLEYFDKFKKFK